MVSSIEEGRWELSGASLLDVLDLRFDFLVLMSLSGLALQYYLKVSDARQVWGYVRWAESIPPVHLERTFLTQLQHTLQGKLGK